MPGAFSDQSLGPMHLSANKNYEPQRTNHFQLEIYGLDGSGTEEIMLATEEISAPKIGNSVLEIGHGNSKVHYAGKAEYTGMDNLSVIDYILVDIADIVDNWRRQVYDPETDQIGFAEEYKKDAMLTEFAPNGTQLRAWKIKGIWPNEVDFGGTFTHEGEEVKKITMTMTYDKAWKIKG